MSALYLHIPFCLSKCPYCDFYSRLPLPGEIGCYVAALGQDLSYSRTAYADVVAEAPLASVFFGGGTPSLLAADQVAQLLTQAEQLYDFSADVEITLEVNPGTVNLAQLSAYRQAGVNRLSIGVQSFSDKNLLWLGRRHTSAEAIQAFDAARQAGFDNVSIDLMFALPGQTLEDIRYQCRMVQQLNPEHISFYGLTVEDGTPFAAQQAIGAWQVPEDELYRQMFLLGHELLGAQGYEHYEISNYARPNARCRHNVGYWQRQPYLGVGAGAHSFFARGWGERWFCANSIHEYLSAMAAGQSPRQKLEDFTREQAMAESAYLALRCSDGVDEERFATTFDHDFNDVFAAALANCQPHVIRGSHRVGFDSAGWLVYNHLIENFL
jgi:oxygen-independent coproporphyrinogen-3 oxidase